MQLTDHPRLPAQTCDTHSHIYSDPHTHAICPGHYYEEGALLDDYLSLAHPLGVQRLIIVQPKAYGTNPAGILQAIAKLGIKHARGVIMADPQLSFADLKQLHQAGIRGVRYLYPQNTPVDVPAIQLMADKVSPLRWSILVQGDANALAASAADLINLPSPVVIDHMGRLPPNLNIAAPEFQAFIHFLKNGGWIKLSAPYYASPDGSSDFSALRSHVHALLDAGLERIIWGMNWPHLSFPAGRKPDDATTLDSLLKVLRSDSERQAIFVDNPARLYGFTPAI